MVCRVTTMRDSRGWNHYYGGSTRELSPQFPSNPSRINTQADRYYWISVVRRRGARVTATETFLIQVAA